jgi:hypothetical protein
MTVDVGVCQEDTYVAFDASTAFDAVDAVGVVVAVGSHVDLEAYAGIFPGFGHFVGV